MRKFLALSFVQRALMLAVYLAATMVLARLLTPEQIGIFSMTAAFVGVAAAIREFGMSEFLIQERHLTRETIRATYGVAIFMGWLVCALVLALAPTIAAAYKEPQVLSIAYVLSLNFVLLPFATPSMALLIREMDLGKAWGVQTAAVIAQYVVSIVLAWRGLGPISLAWGSVASSICSVALLNIVRPAEIRLLPTLKGSRSAWRYGFRFAAASSLEVAAKNVHEFVIPRAFGFAALGLYSRAAGLFEQFNQNFTRAISRVLHPTFAQDAREGTFDLALRYGTATSHFTCVAWSFFAFVAIAAPHIVQVLFGDQWINAAPLLRLMCLAGVIQCSYAFAGDVLASFGEIGSKLRIISVTTPAWVVLCFLGAAMSVDAIAILSAGPALISLALYSRHLRRLIGFSFGDLLSSTTVSALIAALVAAAILISLTATSASIRSSFLQLTLMSGVAAVTWLLAVFLLRHPLATELTQLPSRIGALRIRG